MQICLIGVAHPCHNPRLLREADSLAEMGHEVCVVAPSISPELAERDRRHMAVRRWRLQSVDCCPIGLAGKWRSFVVRGKRRFASEVFQTFGGEYLAETGYTTALSRLKRTASLERADWFIAHTQAALPVAVSAAKKFGARVGFDCEDLLSATDGGGSDVVRLLEKKYLQSCSYVSVPSELIARRLVDDYGIRDPVVLYNCFPTKLAAKLAPPSDRVISNTMRVHWFSQTIGPGRGLEEAIDAIGMLNGPAELHIRGHVLESYRNHIEILANQRTVELFVHPLIDHDLVIESLRDFDIGLALERTSNDGYSLTISNKIFSYLLAGLAVAASDTPGQREAMQGYPEAGFLYPCGSSEALANALQRWLDNRESLLLAQQSAWNAARERFCWDLEQQKFLEQLALSVPTVPLAHSTTA